MRTIPATDLPSAPIIVLQMPPRAAAKFPAVDSIPGRLWRANEARARARALTSEEAVLCSLCADAADALIIRDREALARSDGSFDRARIREKWGNADDLGVLCGRNKGFSERKNAWEFGV